MIKKPRGLYGQSPYETLHNTRTKPHRKRSDVPDGGKAELGDSARRFLVREQYCESQGWLLVFDVSRLPQAARKERLQLRL